MYVFSNNTSWKYWRIFLKTYLLLTPIKALTPFNLVLTLPCPTMKVMSKKLGTSSLLSLGYWKALVKSLASWSCPSKRSRTESKSGLEGLIWPMGRQEPRLKKEKEIFRQHIENVNNKLSISFTVTCHFWSWISLEICRTIWLFCTVI